MWEFGLPLKTTLKNKKKEGKKMQYFIILVVFAAGLALAYAAANFFSVKKMFRKHSPCGISAGIT